MRAIETDRGPAPPPRGRCPPRGGRWAGGVGGGGAWEPVTATTAIPVGGGVVFTELGVVITQPTPGIFVGFDSTCPHRGCGVRAVAAGTINCFCHGSRFRIDDGSVAGGPAEQPLVRRSIVIREGRISLG